MDLVPRTSRSFLKSLFLVPTCSALVLCVAATVHGGLSGIGSQRSVGGVMIDAAGVVRTATAVEKQDLANTLRESLSPAQGELDNAAELRMISLAGLQKAITQSEQDGKPIPEDIEFLAGLQRVDYVFVDTDKHDIVIAGPAEPWKLLDDGSVVGTISGGSTMRLADLVVAMRSVEVARNGGISCSIEPTPEGRRRLQQMLSRVKLRPGQNPAIYEATMKEAYGPQMIHLAGIPADSRYARTLVASDFEMKRVAMGLAPSPVAGLPSYLEMAKNSRQGAGQNPRWWMACDYDALARSDDGLAWKISGRRVKTMTEQDLVAADGTVKGGGRVDKTAQAWADKMTDSFGELAKEIPVFADLENVMDLTVVATLIVQERLAETAGVDLATLSKSNGVELASYAVPRSIDPQCSFIRGRAGWVVTASGGVDINAFSIIENQKTESAVGETRGAMLASATDRWWWNK
ncbi:hypothetical protein K227x_37690 [Rubripirellula lacrimiformis]|uniref:DUF1598 domain-containing protein n=1 Tax=Rubripirellula lacrimiformis TaxID=1930273 RepID=A0A517NE14_9BACT|nr:DUF1598 domain-containing protein [Rubripirellula lacrimiformis]QDT05369.1 hypothetical protein K227x_37690 [Rubripirellula lacrimiformis]